MTVASTGSAAGATAGPSGVRPLSRTGPGTRSIPALPEREALMSVMAEFAQAITERRPPLTDARCRPAGTPALLEAASQSADRKAASVPLTTGGGQLISGATLPGHRRRRNHRLDDRRPARDAGAAEVIVSGQLRARPAGEPGHRTRLGQGPHGHRRRYPGPPAGRSSDGGHRCASSIRPRSGSRSAPPSPRLALEVLVDGTYEVVEAAANAGVRKVVAASSASVYGLATEFPTAEDHHPYANDTLYGAAKTFNEGLLRSFHAMRGLDYVALRYFNVYGPRMDIYGLYTEVLIRWMERIEAGQPPLILGDGKQTMDFVFTEDIARANLLAAAGGRHRRGDQHWQRDRDQPAGTGAVHCSA